MMEITIHVTGLESLADAIGRLAGGKAVPPTPAAGGQPGVLPPAAASIGYGPSVPPAPIPASAPAPVSAGLPMPGPVPTTVIPQEYTQDQIAVAMTGLNDQGRGADLIRILGGFGVSSLVQVPKERYPELVLALREAGAAI